MILDYGLPSGVHPHKMLKGTALQIFSKLERRVQRHPQALAIGEVGLDFCTTCPCVNNRYSIGTVLWVEEGQTASISAHGFSVG